VFRGDGSLEHLSVAQLDAGMGNDWASGTVAMHYRAKSGGWTRKELESSLAADADFDLFDGMLRNVSLGLPANPLRARRFSGTLGFKNDTFTISAGKLQTPSGIYQVSGTALIDKKLNITLVRDGSHAFEITGTLGTPKVVVVSRPQTQAALTK